MAKLFIQGSASVLSHDGSLTANQLLSGSAHCQGYGILVGAVYSSCTSESSSGLRVYQSMNRGQDWDVVSASDALAASATATCATTVVGNAVKVEYKNGAVVADEARAYFYLRPF